MKKSESAKSPKEIVMKFAEALKQQDFKTVRSSISDNISVLAPGPRPVELITFNRAEPYVTYLENSNLSRFEIKKEFADNNDVCLLYDAIYREPVVTVFVCGWFHVNDDRKIDSIRFVADPRTLLEQMGNR
jgi:limonene-1,2-epoxide hydrolase